MKNQRRRAYVGDEDLRLRAVDRHYVLVLPDGTEIGFYGPSQPTPETLEVLQEVVDAVRALSPEQRRELARRHRETRGKIVSL